MKMISFGNLGGGGGSGKQKQQAVTLPRDVKDAVSKCREAIQAGLTNRISRMYVEMPVGTKFGVESKQNKSNNKKPKSMSDSENGSISRDTFETSDREFARLILEMFLVPLGGNAISIIFMEDRLATLAKKQWSIPDCQITSLISNKKSKANNKTKNKKKNKGFAAIMEAELNQDSSSSSSSSGPFRLPESCELAIFVAPSTPKQFLQIERICSDVGMGTLIILLNARSILTSSFSYPTESAKTLFQQDFESTFHLSAAPQDVSPGCLIYRAFPKDWVLARKPKVGTPKTILSQEQRPTKEDCQVAYDSLEINDMERGVETLLDNVATWFK